jgi:hypothetical protein
MLTNDEITFESLSILESELGASAHTTRKYEGIFGPAKDGHSASGSTIRVRKPPLFDVVDGPDVSGSFQAVEDDYVDMAIDKFKSVPIVITEEEMSLKMNDFSEQVIKPAMSTLAHKVEAEVFAMYKKVWQYVGVPETVTATQLEVLQAGAILDDSLCPRDGQRAIFLNPETMAQQVNARRTLFENRQAIKEQYRRGLVAKDVDGFDWHMSQMVRSHTSGANTGAMLIDGADQTGSSLLLDDGTASNPGFKEGDILNLTGYKNVNFNSKDTLNRIRNVVVTADVTIDATGDETTVPISPEIVLTGKKQNTAGSLADAEDVLLFGHASSYVSKTFAQNMAWHKNAIALAFARLVSPDGQGAKASVKTDPKLGISVRFSRWWDGDQGLWKARFDIYFGLAMLRPEWCVRIFG